MKLTRNCLKCDKSIRIDPRNRRTRYLCWSCRRLNAETGYEVYDTMMARGSGVRIKERLGEVEV